MKPLINMIQNEQRRRIFIRAGKAVLRRKGVYVMKIRDVIREADAAPGSFYSFFRDKDALMAAIVEETTIPFRIAIRDAKNKGNNAYEALEYGLRACVDLVVDDVELSEMIAVNRHETRKFLYMPRIHDPIYEELVADLQQAVDKGLFKPHNCQLLASSLISLVMDLIIKAAIEPQAAQAFVPKLAALVTPMIENRQLRALASLRARRNKRAAE